MFAPSCGRSITWLLCSLSYVRGSKLRDRLPAVGRRTMYRSRCLFISLANYEMRRDILLSLTSNRRKCRWSLESWRRPHTSCYEMSRAHRVNSVIAQSLVQYLCCPVEACTSTGDVAEKGSLNRFDCCIQYGRSIERS